METITKTTDSGMFKTIEGNRPVMEGHVRRLMASFQKKYLKSPIFVNSKGFVIDGQHRLEAAKRLKLPIYYLRVNGYGLEEVQSLNTNNTVWNRADYLSSYCTLGIEPYLRLKEFMGVYPDFKISVAELILSDSKSGINERARSSVNGHTMQKSRPFEEGKFVVSNLKGAYENAAKIMEYKPFFSGFANKSFVRVLIGLFKNKKFNHEIMIRKLKLQPTALVKCATGDQYLSLLEEIYNYMSRNKVSLRY